MINRGFYKIERLFFIGSMSLVLITSANAFQGEGQGIPQIMSTIKDLVNNNIAPVGVLVGVGGSIAFSMLKQTFKYAGIGVGLGALYGLTKTWIQATYALLG